MNIITFTAFAPVHIIKLVCVNSVHVCLCAVCVYVHACMCVRACVYVHAWVCMYMGVHTCVSTHVGVYKCEVCVCACAHLQSSALHKINNAKNSHPH